MNKNLASQMGVKPEDFDLFRTNRSAWEAKVRGEPSSGPRGTGGATPTMSLGGAKDIRSGAAPARDSTPALAVIDRLSKAMNINPEEFAKWRADQLQLAIERSRRGEPLTQTQEDLLAVAATTPPRIVPVPAAATIGTLERITRSTPAAFAGRRGTMRMDTFGETR